MTDKLKPCPFCGENGSIVTVHQHDSGNYQVYCGACGCSSGSSQSRDNVVDHWNARPVRNAESQRLPDVIERIKESLAYFHDEFPKYKCPIMWSAPVSPHCGGVTPDDLQTILEILGDGK